MGIPLKELLRYIPTDTEQRVEAVRGRLNHPLREALRQDTALRLNRGTADDGRSDFATVPVRLVPGLPAALAKKELPEDAEIAPLISMWRGPVEALRDASRSIDRGLVPLLVQRPAGRTLLADRQGHLLPVFELAEDLLREAGKFDLLDWILEVNRDVLGAYFFGGQGHVLNPTNEIRVEVYWGVIGIVAQVLAASVEDLTAVVLGHELAHAYTHLGLDIDRQRWDTKHFGTSDHELVEGLAQYYTRLALGRILHLHPSSIVTFDKLAHHQPPAYNVHETWVRDYTPEVVRSAMLETRSSGIGSVEEFNFRLRRELGRLQRHGPGRKVQGGFLPGFGEQE